MGSFFERLQNFGRLYENNAPVYLRTHPLTTERIADMGNRISQRPYRQVPDSLDFLLVRAKLKAQEGDAREAVTHFASLVKERKFSSEPAAHYGYALALARVKDWVAAERELGQARRFKVASPMIETLAADLRRQQGDADGALLSSDDPQLGDAVIWTFGVERAFGDGTLLVTFAANAKGTPIDRALLFDRAFLPGLIAAWNRTERWGSWRIVWTAAFEHGDGLLKAEIADNLTDEWRATLGADFPYGSRYGPFGALWAGRRAWLAVRRSW